MTQKVKVITGFVPIADHVRSASEYGALGDKLAAIRVAPLKAFYTPQDKCWMHKFVWENGPLTHSTADNPAKNSMAYHIVQHQKFEWLAQAASEDPEPDVFVWVDYGIFHVPGTTLEIIEDFLGRVSRRKIPGVASPSCDGWTGPIDDRVPWWRFCGGLLIVPRAYVWPLAEELKEATKRNIWHTKNVTWEVNDLARVEKHGRLPFSLYEADHNQTMFTNFYP